MQQTSEHTVSLLSFARAMLGFPFDNLLTNMINSSIRWALCVATLVGLAGTANLYNLSSSEWASWVQAIGSIAAIVGAFTVAHNQFMREQALQAERQREVERKLFRIIKAILMDIETVTQRVISTHDLSGLLAVPDSTLKALEEAANPLLGLPTFEIPHEGLVLVILPLKRQIDHACQSLRHEAAEPEMMARFARIQAGRTDEELEAILSTTAYGTSMCESALRDRISPAG